MGHSTTGGSMTQLYGHATWQQRRNSMSRAFDHLAFMVQENDEEPHEQIEEARA